MNLRGARVQKRAFFDLSRIKCEMYNTKGVQSSWQKSKNQEQNDKHTSDCMQTTREKQYALRASSRTRAKTQKTNCVVYKS